MVNNNLIDQQFICINTANKIKKINIIGLMIIRNESLILQDSLDSMSKIVDAIIVLDDASTDNSVYICLKHPKVLSVVINKKWINDASGKRYIQESIHRQKILQLGRIYKPKWFLYMDADERIDGDIRNYMIKNINNKKVRGIRLGLFDAYMTKDDFEPYKSGKELYNLRKNFGQERRDILMAWKNNKNVNFKTSEMCRVPVGVPEENTVDMFYVQHYGKALSIDHWEETCDFYVKYFPIFAEKWGARKGKSIHIKSDFDTELMSWSQVKKTGGIKIG